MVFSFLTFSQNIEAVSAIILLLISFLALETVFRNMWIMLFGLAVMMLIIDLLFLNEKDFVLEYDYNNWKNRTTVDY